VDGPDTQPSELLVCELAVGDSKVTLPSIKREAGFRRLAYSVPCVIEGFQGVGESGAGRAKIAAETLGGGFGSRWPKEKACKPEPEIGERSA
jgi:hypothetical protein